MKNAISLIILVLLGLVACTGTGQSTSTPSNLPTPTLHPFLQPVENTPTPDGLAPETFTATATPPLLTVPPPAEVTPLQVITTTLYADALSPNWQILDTEGITSDLTSTDEVHTGRFSIAMTPSEDLSTFYFVVREDAQESYPQDQVLTLSFWINGGDDIIAPEDLAIAIIGSNDYPYWVEGDKSVYTDDEFPFSETRLYFLEFNTSIPSHTWVQVLVTLDDLIYDPVYNYVTGFYIKNDVGFYNTIYVDDIELVLLDPESAGQ